MYHLKSPFMRNCKIGSYLTQSYATLYLRIGSKDLFEMLVQILTILVKIFASFNIMIYSNDFFEVFRVGQMGSLDQTAPNLCNFISHDPL